MEPPEPSQPLKRRWRWRQYRLSTLLVVVTLISAILALVVLPAERQRRAVAAIREAGGYYWYDFQPDDNTPGEPPGPDWLCHILGMDYFADVVLVDAGSMTDSTCSHLSALTSLQVLGLRDTQVTDAGLAHLAGLTSLQRLSLGTKVTDAGLAHLARLTSLESLYLSNTQVTDAGLAHLFGLTSLQTLYLEDTRVTHEGCEKLRQALPNCYVRH
ncbi:MAG: leucine-rich repeat domain-containing protein [Pirellulales bacterium]